MVHETTTFEVHVQPGARCDEITAINNRILRTKVKAQPHKGQANRAVQELISKVLGVPKNQIDIVRGHASRNKVLTVRGLRSDDVRERIDRYLEGK